MSGEYVSKLKRRAFSFLKAAEEDVKRITRAAENLISLLDRVVRDVKLG